MIEVFDTDLEVVSPLGPILQNYFAVDSWTNLMHNDTYELHILCRNIFFFKKNGPISASFCFYFRSFLATISIQTEKSIDGVLGIRTWGRRMVGADETTELWRPPSNYVEIS